MDAKDKWAKIIQEYESSGMTKAKFCRSKNMSYKSFQNGYYRYKKNRMSKESSLVPVTVDNPIQPVIRFSINHIPLEFKQDICDDDLKKILKAVVSL